MWQSTAWTQSTLPLQYLYRSGGNQAQCLAHHSFDHSYTASYSGLKLEFHWLARLAVHDRKPGRSPPATPTHQPLTKGIDQPKSVGLSHVCCSHLASCILRVCIRHHCFGVVCPSRCVQVGITGLTALNWPAAGVTRGLCCAKPHGTTPCHRAEPRAQPWPKSSLTWRRR